MAVRKVNLDEKLALVREHWSPKTISRMNDYEIKLVKVQGEFVWHQHDDTDEVFLVLDGELTIETEDGFNLLDVEPPPHDQVVPNTHVSRSESRPPASHASATRPFRVM